MTGIKKLVCFILAFAVLFCCCTLSACESAENFEIAMIVGIGDINDKSFNWGTWIGVRNYANQSGKTAQYYDSEPENEEGYLAAIALAIQNGAKTVVCPGYNFETTVFEAQTLYPDVKFILVDGTPHNAEYTVYKCENNVAAVFFEEEQSGFLAGYAAAIDGFRKLAFMGGMAIASVQAFGYGFLQGLEYAANELNLANNSIEVKYHYTGNFVDTLTNRSFALGMYNDKTEIIFSCGGDIIKSVIKASSETGGKIIGVDVDQMSSSSNIITSAEKNLGVAVMTILSAIDEGRFSEYGGKSTYFTAANNGVGLSVRFDRFEIFTREKYNEIYAKIVNGEINIIRTLNLTTTETAADLERGLSLHKVNVYTL